MSPAANGYFNLGFDEERLRRWVPEPDVLVGQRIAGDSTRCRALSSLINQLSPEFVVAPPLPAVVLEGQVGALLALGASTKDTPGLNAMMPPARSFRPSSTASATAVCRHRLCARQG
ncbi:hypothetical protein ACWGS9_27915 [Bradyrhizobium sp. Arg314]